MPKVFDWGGFRFHFFSNEGNPREPAHVHVTKGRDTAKFWISPEVSIAYTEALGQKCFLNSFPL